MAISQRYDPVREELGTCVVCGARRLHRDFVIIVETQTSLAINSRTALRVCGPWNFPIGESAEFSLIDDAARTCIDQAEFVLGWWKAMKLDGPPSIKEYRRLTLGRIVEDLSGADEGNSGH